MFPKSSFKEIAFMISNYTSYFKLVLKLKKKSKLNPNYPFVPYDYFNLG